MGVWKRKQVLRMFNVCQFYRDGSYKYVRRNVTAEDAVTTFKQHTASIGALAGFVRRVIITDSDDCINMEWQFNKGITFPNKEGKPAEISQGERA